MDIQQILVLRGPNIWANFPVIEVWVDLRSNLDVPSNTFPGFNDRLKSWLPSMIEHRCGLGVHGGFFQRLDTGTYLGHILEHTSLEIQSLVGPVVGFGRARETYVAGIYRVAIEYAEERLGLACVHMTIRLLTAARTGEAFDINAELAQLKKLAEEHCFGPSTQAIVTAAKKRDIPWIRLADNSLVQLGYGSAQRRIWTAETDDTSAVAESIAQDKELTRMLLSQAGVPVPQGQAVTSAEEAWCVAQELGLPVVVKPREGHHGDGVSIDLSDRASVLRAYEIADGVEYGRGQGVIVEQCIQGVHHRILVVGDRVVAAAQGEPDYVVADGKHSVRQLVDIGNQNPNRGDPEIHHHDRLVLDDIAINVLSRQGLTVDHVPSDGRRVILHYNGDLPNDVTRLVHPEVARIAVLAAKTVGLNIAGVDMVLTDIARSPEEQHGAVLEVNASPSLLMHTKPLRGEPQPVGEAIVDQLFAAATRGRIPIVAVSGTNGKTSVVAILDSLLASAGTLGIAGSDGLWVGGRALERQNATDYENVARLLVNPIVDVMLVEMDPRTILEQGIAFDRCQVAVVTNLGSADHLGLPLMDRDRMLLVERCGVDMVLPDGMAVLNADDADVLTMAAKCPGKILLFSRRRDAQALSEQRAKGGRTLGVDAGAIYFEEGAEVLHSMTLPATVRGFPLENLLSAMGAAWAFGQAPADIARTIESTHLASGSSPVKAARWRSLKSATGATVVVSVARNLSAFEAAVAYTEHCAEREGLGAERKVAFARRTAIQTHLPADWRSEDAFIVGSFLGKQFDSVELRVETQLAQGNVGANPTRNGQSESALAEAFAEGVRSQNHAELAVLPSMVQVGVTALQATITACSLLFVQVGNFERLASFALPEEELPNSGSNSGATNSKRHDGSLAEV